MGNLRGTYRCSEPYRRGRPGANTRSADVRSIWGLTANGRSWRTMAQDEQAFPAHPFTGATVTPPEETAAMASADASQSPALRLQPTTVPPRPSPPEPPALRVLEGGRAPAPARPAGRLPAAPRAWPSRPSPPSWWSLVLLVGAVSARLAGGGHPSSAGGSSPTSAVALRAAEVAASSWVVQPGDTLWSIAADGRARRRRARHRRPAGRRSTATTRSSSASTSCLPLTAERRQQA